MNKTIVQILCGIAAVLGVIVLGLGMSILKMGQQMLGMMFTVGGGLVTAAGALVVFNPEAGKAAAGKVSLTVAQITAGLAGLIGLGAGGYALMAKFD